MQGVNFDLRLVNIFMIRLAFPQHTVHKEPTTFQYMNDQSVLPFDITTLIHNTPQTSSADVDTMHK